MQAAKRTLEFAVTGHPHGLIHRTAGEVVDNGSLRSRSRRNPAGAATDFLNMKIAGHVHTIPAPRIRVGSEASQLNVPEPHGFSMTLECNRAILVKILDRPL